MLIIPVGTKSTLALKPKITLTLIAICIIVHILSGMSGGSVRGDIFKIHRDMYSAQVHLYLLENDPFYQENGYFEEMQQYGLESIKSSGSYEELESAIFQAMGNSFTCFADLEKFGNELYARDDSYYATEELKHGLFTDWKRLSAREDKALGGLVSYNLGLVPRKMNRVWTFITHLFLHGDIWHLLGNMLFLWVVGCLLEDTWGRWPFLAFYIAGGIFAGWAHCLQDTSSGVPLIGASGAIAAAMGAFTVRHFMTKIRFFYFFIFFFRPFWGTFHLPAFVFLPFWFLQQVAMKHLSDFTGGSGVAYLAHIAGYLGGVIAALVLKATGAEEKWLNPMVAKKQVSEGVLKDPRFDEACELIRGGSVERAKILFSQLLSERQGDHDLAHDIAMIYREAGLETESGNISEMALKDLLMKSRMEEASAMAIEMISSGAGDRINPQLLMRVGKHLADSGMYGEAHDVYRCVIRANRSPSFTAKTSIALARLLGTRMNNTRDALVLLEEAERLDIDEELKATVRQERIAMTEEKSTVYG